MKLYHIIKKLIFFIFIIGFVISCATERANEDAPIIIKDISFNLVSNRVPKESDFQKEIELFGIVSEDNLLQDIKYEWEINYFKLDINDKNAIITTDLSGDNSTDLFYKNRLYEKYFFLDIAKDPLHALLSIYKPGYYKITLHASNTKEIKENAVILKIGEPVLPELWVKVNIPTFEKNKLVDYKGQLFLQVNDLQNKKLSPIIEIKAEKMQDSWYNTGIEINPFNPFNIQAGTHLLETNSLYLASINKQVKADDKDGFVYSMDDNKEKYIYITPIVLKNITDNAITISAKTNKKWNNGTVFISYLMWGTSDEGKDEFTYLENELNIYTLSVKTELDKKYLAKIFIGSYGHRIPFNNYYIYFGPEGTEADELDPKNKRDYPGLPYGHLIGKLGNDGNIFSISNQFTYIFKNKYRIFKLENDKFIEVE